MGEVDLLGKLCPYAVVEVVRRVERMGEGQTLDFLVDDPLAAKSIPEELAEFDGVEFELMRLDRSWRVHVER